MINQWIKLLSIAVLLVFVGLIVAFKSEPVKKAKKQEANDSQKQNWANEPILPIPADVDLDARKVALGEKLFNDPQFSHDNTISCASCHSLSLGGTDQLPRSIGVNGQRGAINAPTVFNAVYNFKQFWDGRAESLEEQIDGPTHSAAEMGSNWEEIVQKLRNSSEYVSAFSPLYNQGIEINNIKDAIATYERSLVTPDSRFDQFLRGDQNILTADEKEGYRVFKSVGCISCHQGINVGGNLFEEFGVMGNYFTDRGSVTEADLGRFNVTKKESDKHVFKVPSLRNVALTKPYFHDGSAETLEDAVSVMSKYQLGRQLSAQEIDSIVKFLKTLSGEYKRENL